VLCCVVVNVPPAQAEPSHGNGIKAAGKDAADAAHLAAVAEVDFDVVTDGLHTLLPAYAPIVHRRSTMDFGERQRQWQLLRRGRYVEFNLIYDKGTLFGLQTGGNIESILMSLPPTANWAFNVHPEEGTPEADLGNFLQARDWAGLEEVHSS